MNKEEDPSPVPASSNEARPKSRQVSPSKVTNLAIENKNTEGNEAISTPAPTNSTQNPASNFPSPLPSAKSPAPSTFDELMEKKMVADIMRANNNLKALKQFRATSEKFYQDKYNDEMKRREIREPLEKANIEIQLLKGKVLRRDETIKSLRRFILVDSLRNVTGGDVNANSVQDFMKNEEFKELQISDENAALMKIIKSHETEIMKLKSLIQSQQNSIKDLNDEIQKKDFLQQEIIRKYETEKEHHLTMIEKRDQRINRLCNDLETLQNEKKDLEIDFDEKVRQLDKAEDKIKELLSVKESTSRLKEEYEERIEELKDEINEQKEENIIVNEKMIDLQARYDNLVNELDQMVEGGYHHRDVITTSFIQAQQQAINQVNDDDNSQLENDDQSETGSKLTKTKKPKSRKTARGKSAGSVSTAMKKHRASQQVVETLLEDDLEDEESTISDTNSMSRNGSTLGRKSSNTPATHQPFLQSNPSQHTFHGDSRKASQGTVASSHSQPLQPYHQQPFPQQTTFAHHPAPSAPVSALSSAAPSRAGSMIANAGKISLMGSVSALMKNQQLIQQQLQQAQQQYQGQLPNHVDGQGQGLVDGEGMGEGEFIGGGNIEGGTRRSSDMSFGGGKFFIRKLEEDAILNEKLIANAAIRMKDQLIEQIGELETKLNDEKLEKEKAYDSFLIKEKGWQLKDHLLSSEIARLNKEVAMITNAYLRIKFDLGETKNAFNTAQKTISELQSANASRLNTANNRSPDTLNYRPMTDPLNPQPPPSGSFYNESGVFFSDEDDGIEEGSYVSHSRSKSGYGGGGGSMASAGGAFDPLAFLGAAAGNDSMSLKGGSSSYHREYDEDGEEIHSISKNDDGNKGVQTKQLLTNHSAQFNIEDLPLEMRWNTDSHVIEEELHLKKEQLLKQEKQLNSMLSDFYENFQLIIYEFLPKDKFQILNFDYKHHKSSWQYELKDLGILSSLDIHWQVKQSLLLIISLNELRNEFVTQLFSIHPTKQLMLPPSYLLSQESSIESTETFYQENLIYAYQIQCTMIIHIIDLMIQSMHYLLSPVYHLQRSEYPEIERIFSIITQKQQLYQFNSQDYPSKQSHYYHQQQHDSHTKTQLEIIQKYKDSLGKNHNNIHGMDIFPLTQPNLTTDLGHGIRKGTLGTGLAQQPPMKNLHKPIHQPSFNKQHEPRRLPAYVDQLLDALEARNLSRSPSPVRYPHPPTDQQSRSPSPLTVDRSHSPPKARNNQRDVSPNQHHQHTRPLSANFNGTKKPNIMTQMMTNRYSVSPEEQRKGRSHHPRRAHHNHRDNGYDQEGMDIDDGGLESKLLTGSISDSFVGLPQNQDHPHSNMYGEEDGDDGEDDIATAIENAKRKFEISSMVEEQLLQQQQQQQAKKINYQHYYLKASTTAANNSTQQPAAAAVPTLPTTSGHPKLTTTSGLKSLFSHSADAHDVLPHLASVVPLQAQPLLLQQHQQQQAPAPIPKPQEFADFTRMKFNPDLIESNPWGGKVKQKLQKTSPRSIPVNESQQQSSQIQFQRHLELSSPVSDKNNSHIITIQGINTQPEKNNMQFTDTLNTPQTLPNQQQQQKQRFSAGNKNRGGGDGYSIDLTTVAEGNLEEKSSSLQLLSHAPPPHSIIPPPKPALSSSTLAYYLHQQQQQAKKDDNSTITTSVNLSMIVDPQQQYRYHPVQSAHNVEIVPKQPQAPNRSRPTSATTATHNSGGISRTLKNLTNNAASANNNQAPAVTMNITGQRPLSGSATRRYPTNPSATVKYYVPTIQTPAFVDTLANHPEGSQEDVPPERIRIVITEMESPRLQPQPLPMHISQPSPSVNMSGPNSASQQTPRTAELVEGLAISGKRTNTAKNSHREKVTNALLAI